MRECIPMGCLAGALGQGIESRNTFKTADIIIGQVESPEVPVVNEAGTNLLDLIVRKVEFFEESESLSSLNELYLVEV